MGWPYRQTAVPAFVRRFLAGKDGRIGGVAYAVWVVVLMVVAFVAISVLMRLPDDLEDWVRGG
jgi:hypothetical protein